MQEDSHGEPTEKGALSKETVGGVGSNGHKLILGERKPEKKEMGEVRSHLHRLSSQLPHPVPFTPPSTSRGQTSYRSVFLLGKQ